jgi:lipid-A-disaccharide synthase-like uncharacterized protein
MRLFSLFVIGAMIAAAVSLASALFTRDNVGVLEYVVGFTIVIALLAAAAVRSRNLLQSR